jgi:uncharacterized protein
VVVAFSGGVDSTVLLDNCCKALGASRVTALYAISCLQSRFVVDYTRQVLENHFTYRCSQRFIELTPLNWPEFVQNGKERCYYCKLNTYSRFLAEAERDGTTILLDGTNKDDLQKHRPGLRAVRELGVVSPLLQAGLTKAEIREYARVEGLMNHDLPSNSCLATRVREGRAIELEMLLKIEKAEDFLRDSGFFGTRVYPEKNYICLELQEKDLERCCRKEVRQMVVDYFRQQGLGPVFLALSGR